MNRNELKAFLDQKSDYFNNPSFIESDPVFIPHQYTKKQDIEIAGLVAAVFAWGQRITIINKSIDFMERMDHDPFAFVLSAGENDLKNFLGFKHRTFNDTDALYFIHFFKWFYSRYDSLENAFLSGNQFRSMEDSLIHFSNLFFSLPNHPKRTYKHIPNPARNSACKRINMFLRWMVRKDNNGVDFGIWSKIPMSGLVCPCDLHVDRVARSLGLITRKQTDWKTAIELTDSLKAFDPDDPVKYDFALFGMGAEEKLH